MVVSVLNVTVCLTDAPTPREEGSEGINPFWASFLHVASLPPRLKPGGMNQPMLTVVANIIGVGSAIPGRSVKAAVLGWGTKLS